MSLAALEKLASIESCGTNLAADITKTGYFDQPHATSQEGEALGAAEQTGSQQRLVLFVNRRKPRRYSAETLQKCNGRDCP